MQQRNPFDQFDAPVGGMPAGAVMIAPPDPGKAYDGPQAAATLRKTEADIAANAEEQRRKGAVAPFDARKSKAEAAIAELNLAKAAAEARAAGAGGVDPAAGLQRAILDMRAAYAAGPGQTSGLSGLLDFTLSERNSNFDKAASSARGYVGPALGLTASQLNSPKETEAAIGPYIPDSWDFDSNIEASIKRLEGLANDQRRRAGYAGPIEQPRAPSAPVEAAPPQMEIATGATKNVRDPNVEAVVDALIRSGADAAAINAAIAPLGGSGVQQDTVDRARRYLKAHPEYKGGFSDTSRSEANSLRARAAASVPGAFAASALNEAAAGLPGAVFGAENLDAQKRAFPNATAAGGLVGGVAGAAGLELGAARAAMNYGGRLASILASPRTADAIYGGVQGATTTGTPSGALTGAGAGVVGGMFGRGAARVAGRALRGVTDPSVRYFADRGVNLTVGQAVGNSGFFGPILKGTEQRLSGLPVVGSTIGRRYREGLEGFNRLGNAEAVAPLAGQTNPLNVTIPEVGELGVEALRQANSAGYANAVNGRFATADPAYDTAFANARTMAGAIPNTGPAIVDELDAVVPGYFAAGSISGDNGRAAVSELRSLRRSRASDPLGNRTGAAIRQAENAVIDLFERQSPGFAGDLAAANRVNGNVKTIETAVRNAGRNDGLYSAAQLERAAQQSAARYGNNAATTQRPFFELTRAGQSVLPNTVPDSGTAGRLATLALPAALTGAGAGAGYLGGDASTGTYGGLALGALLTAGGSRVAQRVATRALLDRPDALIRIGNRVYDRARIGGMFGAGLGVTGATLLAQ